MLKEACGRDATFIGFGEDGQDGAGMRRYLDRISS